LNASATTDCATGSSLIFNYQVDKNNDGSIDLTGSSDEVSEIFPLGEHRIIFTVSDDCNNSITCEYLFTLGDTELPVPVCLNGLATVIMPSSGAVTIWASDFESGSSFDNCSNYQNLIFSFSNVISDNTLEINCDFLFLNNCGAVPVEIWVTDEAGNQDFCVTYIIIQDPNNACGCFSQLTPGLIVKTEEGLNLENFEVCINNINCFDVGNSNGVGSLSGLQNGDLITLNKDINPLNGVTTFDRVLIMQHILGNIPFTSSFDSIAADVDQSETITTMDLMLIQAINLQINTQFPGGDSWVFSPEELVFDENISQYEFTAIKLGDINGSANPSDLNDNSSETRNLDEVLQLFTPNQFLEKGKTYSIPIYAENYQDLVGGQFTMNFEKEKISIDEISTGELAGLK